MGNRHSHAQSQLPEQDGDLDNLVKPFESQAKCAQLVWTSEAAIHLQEQVDQIFGPYFGSSSGFKCSLTITDPSVDECPLIACSIGFVKMYGCELNEVLGDTCRASPFGVAIPDEEINHDAKKQTLEFMNAVKLGEDCRRPSGELESCMSEADMAKEMIVQQKDARKDGTLFDHVVYRRVFAPSCDEKPYVVGLHAEVGEDGDAEKMELMQKLKGVGSTMETMKSALEENFLTFRGPLVEHSPSTVFSWTETAPSDCSSWTESAIASAPKTLSSFGAPEVQQWQEGRFKHVKTLCKSTRNAGVVQLRRDLTSGKLVAVKQMPNSWMRRCQEEFLQAHPNQGEMPWKCIACTRFLNSVDFPFACKLLGVFRSSDSTYITTEYCSGGDLFDLAQSAETPGPQREHAFSEYVTQLLYAVKQLHDMQIVHRDISLENILLTPGVSGELEIRVIDFGMASTRRHFRNPSGKVSYVAPEMHVKGLENDGFLCDTFAVGVIVHTLFAKGYPWASTKLGTCKCYEYFQKHGYRAYCAKQKVRGTDIKVIDCFSEPLLEMVEGLLNPDPKERLTLGQKELSHRRSVWGEKWIEQCRTFSLG
jgi:serine/threonine protein kinase